MSIEEEWEAYAKAEGLVWDMPNSTERRAFVAGASRPVEPAPSDTDREVLRWALRNVLTGASVQGDSERGADAVIAAGFSRTSQPVQVEVTDDMVEKAAKAIYENERESIDGARDWPQWDDCRKGSRKSVLNAAHAALSAALGGGE